MDKATQLEDVLYQKMMAEHAAFIGNLRNQSPDQILDRAYEKAIKDDLLMLFKGETNLSAEQLQLLCKQNYPLEELYQGWLKTEDSHMEDLRESINTTTEKIRVSTAHQRPPNKSAGHER